MLNLTKCKIALSNLNWTELYEYISGVYGLLAACAAMWQSERYISRVYCTVCALARVCRHVGFRAIYQPRVLYTVQYVLLAACAAMWPSEQSAACIVQYVLWPACAAMWQSVRAIYQPLAISLLLFPTLWLKGAHSNTSTRIIPIQIWPF